MKKYYKKGLMISLTTLLMLGTASVDAIPFHIISYAKAYEKNILDTKMEDKTEKDIENSIIRFNDEIVTMGTENDFKIDENGVLTSYNGNGGIVIIPKGVIRIKNNAFSGHSNITEVVFPKGITHIGNYAFYNCNGLTKITLPEGITHIGNNAFENCSSLTEVVFPKGITHIEYSTFKNCSSLTEVTLPEGITHIEFGAFGDCSSLTKITFPESLTSIGNCAFENCSSLTKVTLPEGVTHMGTSPFLNCSSLKEVILSKKLYMVEEFHGCTSLEKIVIPGNPDIAKGAFYDCREKLTIYCEPGSLAEEYAYFDNIPYHYIDPSSDLEALEDQLLVNDSSNSNYNVTNTITSVAGEWIKDSIGWWYKNVDNSYPANKWQLINGKWYFFQKTGYMAVGWIYDNHKWYYLNEDGSMKTGWFLDKGIWYYLNENGDMAVNCTTPDGYQVDQNGAWIQ